MFLALLATAAVISLSILLYSPYVPLSHVTYHVSSSAGKLLFSASIVYYAASSAKSLPADLLVAVAQLVLRPLGSQEQMGSKRG